MYRFFWTYASGDLRLGSDFSCFRNLSVQVGTQPHCKKVLGQLARTTNIYWSHTTANSILCISMRIKQRLGIVTIVHMGSLLSLTRECNSCMTGELRIPIALAHAVQAVQKHW